MLPLLLLIQSVPDSGAVYAGRARAIDVAVPRIEAEATVDGVLDEPVWRRAAVLTGFSQYRPADGRPAEDSTEVWAWYAPDAIWFGVRAFERHGGSVVRATLAERDQIDADDYIRILLDTYNDRRRALLFGVNPLGVQQDGVWSDGVDAGAAGGPGAGFRFDATIDINPDFVFASKGRVTEWGYEVEVRIPFKSIRYQAADPQDWGLQVVRFIQHSGYEDTWTPAVRASASFLVQSGRLTGLTGLQRGLVLDFTPEFTTRMDGMPTSGDYVYTAEPQVGGNVRWGVTTNLSLNATANPDFSQVEADVGQVTVNERFALFFPEKRPFFLEGLEQYDTPGRLIYTRRIVSPLAGAKVTGKVGGTNVAYLAAVDDDAFSATGDHPIYNLVRVRRDLGASSTLGLAYTDRIEGSAYNRVLGADARVVWGGIWFSTVQAVGSWSKDASGVRAGEAWAVTLFDRTGRAYGNHGEVSGISPDFEAGSGFVPRTGIATATLFNRFSWYGRPGAWLEQVTTFLGPTILWRYDDLFAGRSSLEGNVSQTWLFTVRGGWGATITYTNAHQRFDPPDYAGYAVDAGGPPAPFIIPHGRYNLWTGSIGGNTPNRALSASANISFGEGMIFAEAAEGRGVDAFAGVTWKPTPSVRVDAQWTHRRITRARDGSWFSTANIPRLKLEYQLTHAIFFRYVGQYVAEERAALQDPRTGDPLVLDPGAEARVGPAAAVTLVDFRNDVLFSYRPTPGTVLFLGYGASLTEPETFRFGDLRRRGDGVFLKASYLFRL